MKLATWLFLLGIACVAKAQTTPDPLDGFKPYLIGISVPNAEQAAMCYEQELGFKREGSDKSSSGTIMIVEAKHCDRASPVQRDVFNSPLQPLLRSCLRETSRISKIAFAVDDLQATLAELKSNQIRVIREITGLKSFDVRFFLIADNNGNLIQISQARRSQPKIEGAGNR